MPLYDYACDACGPFREWRPMSAAGEPAECPVCGQDAPRTIAAPFLANMNPHSRIAHQRNEKSADQPQVVKKSSGHDASAHPHRHCAHGHKNGYSHGHGRPWMIGH